MITNKVNEIKGRMGGKNIPDSQDISANDVVILYRGWGPANHWMTVTTPTFTSWFSETDNKILLHKL